MGLQTAFNTVLRSHRAILTFVAFTIIFATLITWLIAVDTGKRLAAATLDNELEVFSRSIKSEIERFRYLSAIVARDARIRATLTSRSSTDAAAANAYLTDIRADSRADEIYLIAPDGRTLASSNHAETTSFLNQNYSFRPYFKDAMQKGEGRYYAIGATTGIPGYFLSSAIINENGQKIGVAVVKVNLSGLERSLLRRDNPTSVADADGVVFLTSNDSWKFRPLYKLGDETLANFAVTRKYNGIDLAKASPIFPTASSLPKTADTDNQNGSHLLRSVTIEPDEWLVIGTASLGPIHANARLVSLLTALAGMLITGIGLYFIQRRQLIRAKLDERDRLERHVLERTMDLNHEIEDRKRIERELRDAQTTVIQTAKLAALGRMSAAIVHEVSQPLAALENTLAATGLLAKRGDTFAVGNKVESGRDLVRRMQRIVKLLRSFAQKNSSARETVAVEKSVATAVEIIRHHANARGVVIKVDPSLARVRVIANPVQFDQVLINLLANALDAVQGCYKPMIEISGKNQNGMTLIQISDNGIGISNDLLDRIDEPFFTTKKTGEGLGLGLSISRAIIDEFGGSLTFKSHVGEGSVFTVALPNAPAEIQEVAA